MIQGTPNSPRYLPPLLEALGVGLAALIVFLFRDAVVDDAFISLRHARNLLEGHGLVWNPGERVEGITNLAFCLATAGLGALGLDLLVAARLLGLVGAAMAVWLGPCALLPGDGLRLERAVARLWMLSCFAFVYLAWTGLETAAFTGIVAATMYAMSRTGLRFGPAVGLLAGLAFATRPDGIFLSVVALALSLSRHGLRSTLGSAGPWIAGAIGASVQAFRWWYYGALVPAPARVKGLLSNAADSGVPWYGQFGDDFVEFFAETGGAITVLLVVLAIAHATDRKRVWLGAAVVAGVSAFGVYSGGDWMIGYRYLQPMLPAWICLATAGLSLAVRPMASRSRWRALAVVGLVVLAGYGWSFALRFRQDVRAYPQFVMTSHDMTQAAKWLEQRYPEGTTITCWRIGALGYHSRLTVIDTNGLADPEVAARLRDPEALSQYLTSRHPRLALQRGRPGGTPQPQVALYGDTYSHVTTFEQGRDQTWELYERVGP